MRPLAILLYFFRLGITGFGGPLAIIAQIQRDFVEQKKIIPEEEFRRSLSLIKSLPGPVAVQTVTYSAYRLAGLWVALAAAFLFVLPSALMMVELAKYYDQFRISPGIMYFLEGMQAGAFVLILVALHALTKGLQSKPKFWVLLLFSIFFMGWLKISEPLVIIGVGLISLIWPKTFHQNKTRSVVLWELLWICLKAGGLAFGTGFAILPLLQQDFVNIKHWVSQEQFMDALAFGQLTPGPISVTVTFVGYRVAGYWGAAVATIGIFLPGVFNMTTWFPRAYKWFSKQNWIKDFVVGATAAIASGIVLALLDLSKTIVVLNLLIPLLLLVVNLKWKIPSWALVLVSGAAWWAVKLF